MHLLRPALLVLSCSLLGCTGSPSNPPVAAEKPKVEADLVFTNLSKNAYTKLDIQTQKAVVKEVHERLTLTGWIMAKPGNEVTLTAPAAGYVQLGTGAMLPVAGDRVSATTELLQIRPVLSPVEQIQVNALKRSIEGELKKALTTLKTAESDYLRIKGLFEQNLRSKQEYELALKARDHAIEERDAATDKLKLFALPAIPICSPQKGAVLQTHVGTGQYVSASAPLVTIIDLAPMWIRVPVPEFDLPRIDPKEKVWIAWRNFDNDKAPALFSAIPTGRVSQVDPLKHTADIWYELENFTILGVPKKKAGGETATLPGKVEWANFVKDQMVTVRVPIGKKEKATVLPYSALIFDAHGHGWIYVERPQKDSKHQFERRPIELVGAEDENVIVRTTLTGGEPVVTRGAAILFSRDFHKTPLKIDGEDD